MSHSYSHSIYIGRFQPFHLGHAQMLAQALAVAQRCIVVIGSAHQAATPKNPFDWQMRVDMIRRSLPPEEAARVDFLPLRDYYDGDRWAHALRGGVDKLIARHAGPDSQEVKVALISHFKDASSAYLRWFPEWETVAFPRQNEIDATPLRNAFFEAIHDGATPAQALTNLLPALAQGTQQTLRQWVQDPQAAITLAQEWDTLRQARLAWSHSPYTPIFVTVDAVVQCQDHVLLVQRDRMPGAGLMALPGGFIEAHERLDQAVLRELVEETGLDLTPAQAAQARVGSAVFDHPDRSERGRCITHGYHFKLANTDLPAVRGGDDARTAQWVPITQLAQLEPSMHNDHFHILDTFLRILASD